MEMDRQEERLEILASRRDINDEKSIQIHDYNMVNGVEYVKISVDGEVRNLMLHNQVFPYGESPYNQYINSVPYVVIKNDVYEISTFVSVGYNDDDYRKTK